MRFAHADVEGRALGQHVQAHADHRDRSVRLVGAASVEMGLTSAGGAPIKIFANSMAHLLLAVYLLAGVFGRSGFVLCQEKNSGLNWILNWELMIQACCEEDADATAGTGEGFGSVSIKDSGCSCVDAPASIALFHRLQLESPGASVAARMAKVLPPAAPQCERSHWAAGVEPTSRPDLPGYGTLQRILKN